MIPLLVILQMLDGAQVRFSPADHKATAIVFFSAVCPIANDYPDRLRALEKQYSARGVQLLIVYPNRNETADEIRANAKGNEFGFPVYIDKDNRLADQFQAAFTPTAVVLDASGQVRYSGAIDDAQNPARVKHPYLRDALEAVLQGRDPAVQKTAAFG